MGWRSDPAHSLLALPRQKRVLVAWRRELNSPSAGVCPVKALALNDSDCVGKSDTPCRVLSKAWLRRVRRSVPSRAFGISEKMRCLLRRSDGGLTSAYYKPNEPAAAISENCAWLCGCKTFRNRNRGRFIVVEQWDLSRIGNDLRTSHVMRPPRRKPCRRAVTKGSPGLARAEASATEYAVATVCGSMIAQGEACVKQAIIRFCGYPGWNRTGCTTKTVEIHEMAVAPCHCRAVTGGGCGNRCGLQGKN